MEGMVCYLVIIVHVGRNVQPVGAGDAVLTHSGCIGMLCSLWRERKRRGEWRMGGIGIIVFRRRREVIFLNVNGNIDIFVFFFLFIFFLFAFFFTTIFFFRIKRGGNGLLTGRTGHSLWRPRNWRYKSVENLF